MSDQSRKRGPSVSKPGTNEAVQNSSLELGDDAKTRSRAQKPAGASNVMPHPGDSMGPLSPDASDRVFPIRSVVSVEPTPTPSQRSDRERESYFHTPARASDARRKSMSMGSEGSQAARSRQSSTTISQTAGDGDRKAGAPRRADPGGSSAPRVPPQLFSDYLSSKGSEGSGRSTRSSIDGEGLVTARFKHVINQDGHYVVTGRDGDTLRRCEDEEIHIPGAIQSFGLLIALQETEDNKLKVRIASENAQRLIGYTPKQLFHLDSFCDILSDEQCENLLDHIDFIKDEDADVATNGPEVFTMSIQTPQRKHNKLWCAIHVNDTNPGLIICEFELEDDPEFPLVPPTELAPELPEDTLHNQPTAEKQQQASAGFEERKEKEGEAAAMEVFNIMSQVQEQLAAAPNLEKFLKVLVGVVKELTGFHRVMIYQFDQSWNGRVVTELVDPRATRDLYKGLNFPASDIPRQARELYKINRVRLLYDRDQETARLVCRTREDLERPLDLTYSYLRAMSPIHLKYLANMAVRSSMSISINAFNELWGLVACHSYGPRGMRVSFPIRKMCRLIGDSASRNIERLSYASRLQARKLINTAPSEHNPSGYIIASSDDLLNLFDADFGMLSIRDETKILGDVKHSQEALAMLEYLRMRRITSVTASQDITQDFPDLRYPPGFSFIAGLLLVPLSVGGSDFIVMFRKGQLKEVKWAGNPYEKFIKEGTEGYLEPRKSFKAWSETVVGKCREWTAEEIETAAVLCLVYGKFIEVWRQKELALQNSQLTRLLLANSAHEVRTPLNAIINYLEIALEGTLDQETRENLAKSHSASKSLIYVINDLLDLTKAEEGADLVKGKGDATRKKISYEVTTCPDVPHNVVGDQRKIRQAISNVTANAIQNTSKGGVKVEMYVAAWDGDNHVDIEVAVQDTGIGMPTEKLDALFRDFEQVQTETTGSLALGPEKLIEGSQEKRTLGLGLAVVARIIRNINGQLRLKSEEGKGSRFVIQLPFELPDNQQKSLPGSTSGSVTPQPAAGETKGEITLVARDRDQHRGSSSQLVRKNSADSVNSRKSVASSTNSARSDVDRLINAIREPQNFESRPSAGERSISGRSGRPRLESRRSHYASQPASPQRTRTRSIDMPPPEHQRSIEHNAPGQDDLPYASAPVKAIHMPGGDTTSVDYSVRSSRILGEVEDHSEDTSPRPREDEPPSADHMRILIAEDDVINARIITKRLEKLGHTTTLSVNGEECSAVYCDHSGHFDVILMDMQMPIVDGMTSTKMIRSFEKSHPTHMLSTRATLNGRVPIIAVSASLVEKERQNYIDYGFDGWIMKPIRFERLSELLNGIVDAKIREENLYQPGNWERGGWFNKAQPNVNAAKTEPADKIPFSGPSNETKVAASSDDPFVGDGGEGRIPEEQRRLHEQQEEGSIAAPGENQRTPSNKESGEETPPRSSSPSTT
ncbi:hypothetical protein H2199_006052 [Coniosporium tulheliwenetii]|uniref:Uncharacterized protein n=1 Tax=Coniosporium tulheliwenetii TaxID=3383036 RepID=A0ACC2YZB7_9PEZI|nr:hypothetical protein H2199_006052 [Cladosporium sp. JES 115]